jgi:hypothetical protein
MKKFEIKNSLIYGAGRGIFTTVDIPPHTYIDFYKGKRITKRQFHKYKKNPRYVWEIKYGRGYYYVDGEINGNWLSLINDARSTLLNNLEAHQREGKLWYYSKRFIKAGEELYVDYGDDYWSYFKGKQKKITDYFKLN